MLLSLCLALAPMLTPSLAASAAPRAAVVRAQAQLSLDDILRAIQSVESGGHKDNGRHATGDGGRAIGPFQIHKEHWQDSRLDGRFEDCRDLAYARCVVIAYWQRWCPDALARRDAEVLARVHNGGPGGATKDGTLGYWNKVKRALEAD